MTVYFIHLFLYTVCKNSIGAVNKQVSGGVFNAKKPRQNVTANNNNNNN